MNTEEKAMAYDEALSRAKSKLHYPNKPCFVDVTEIFPELCESEDERIRKELITHCRNIRCVTEEGAERIVKWIVWLEKQGGQKPFDYENATIVQKDYAPKVEPKFKVMDWVTNSIETVQITGYDIDYGYQVDYKGNLQHRDTDIIEKEYHLWSIQDAEDGDVLYTPKGAGVEGIFLIKGWEQVECTGKTLCSSIGYRVKDDEIVAGGLGAIWWKGVIDPFYPATKEQRDTLFAKMKEAGYKWDKQEKRLIETPKIKEETGVLKQLIDEEKSAWSEEDEQYLLVCKNALAKYQRTDKWDADIISHWLEDKIKTIKNRVQPQSKQEWSEEDERIYKSIIYSFAHNYPLTIQQQEFVKSLKDRYSWKPTYEQMEALWVRQRNT